MNYRLRSFAPLVRLAGVFSLAFVLFAGAFSALPAANAQPPQTTAMRTRLTPEQRILHVLNRLGFGARPGDVERVREIGLERYIEGQLQPEQIEDAAADAKVHELSSYRMTTAELYQKYPRPGRLLRMLQRQGRLPADLAELSKNRKGEGDGEAAQNGAGAMRDDTAAKAGEGNGNMAEAAPQKNDARREYRQAMQEYFRENGLQPPARITAELQASRILRAVYSERQLQEALVDFWTNHFNVYANKGADRWLLVSYDRDTIRPHTLGKFKDLLLATAQSPAMLFYLDNFQSVSPNAGQATDGRRRGLLMGRNRRALIREGASTQMSGQPQPQEQMPRPTMPPPKRMRRGINENYARELMELHTLGVEGGYTQKDVQEVARCFTGWTIFAPRANAGMMGGNSAGNPARAGSFYFNPRLHDDGEKFVLGHKIPAGGGMGDGQLVLDILARHPATAKFIATKLARRFVADNPAHALIERISAAYTKSDGDIRATLRAVFASPEFNAPENYRAKIKTPFEVAMSAVRALGGETNGGPALHGWIARMGEPLYQYQAPTGYPDTAEHWVNTGALLERLNFALALAGNRINGTRVNLARFTGAGAAHADKSRLIDQFADAVLQGDISPKTKASLLKGLNDARTGTTTAQTPPLQTSDSANSRTATTGEINSDGDATARGGGSGRRGGRRREMLNANASLPIMETARIAALILGSPEFQRQ
ncbi:MAG: DUF1800 domain-containing protein [Pyrinomonadaceae bacterium]